MGRTYDFVIYGASGFTGKCTVKELLKLIRANKIGPVKWAVGGRSAKKLREALQEVSNELGEDLSKIETIEADVAKPESLRAMAKQCSVLITCVGPYRFYGDAVVKACVDEGTNYVDVCGEPQFLENTQLLYNEEAEKKSIYVVGSCGLDSIPTDCGVTLLQQKFDGDVNTVEMFLELQNKGSKPTKMNIGTWLCIIHGIAHANELRALRQKLFTKRMPEQRPKIPQRGVLHYNQNAQAWCLPFPGADRSVVKRSQYFLFHEEKKRPVQLNAYVKMPSIWACFALMFSAAIFGILAHFRVGRYLLEKYPKVFSCGVVTEDGMSNDEMEDVEFKVSLFGEGWKEKLSDPADQHSESMNKKLKVIVSGKNPGYGATCVMLLHSAYTILKESDKMPKKGGVFAPGAAFYRTTLIDRLNASGVNFSVEE